MGKMWVVWDINTAYNTTTGEYCSIKKMTLDVVGLVYPKREGETDITVGEILKRDDTHLATVEGAGLAPLDTTYIIAICHNKFDIRFLSYIKEIKYIDSTRTNEAEAVIQNKLDFINKSICQRFNDSLGTYSTLLTYVKGAGMPDDCILRMHHGSKWVNVVFDKAVKVFLAKVAVMEG